MATACFILSFLVGTFAFSEERWTTFDSSGPYCGLYCVYAALRVFDAPIDSEAVLKAEYVGSSKGSSFAELIQLVQEHGFNASGLQNFSLAALDRSGLPAILHGGQ